MTKLDPNGLYRIKSIVRTPGVEAPLIDIAQSTWWAGVKAGRFPKPVHLGKRTTCWRGSDLLALINGQRGDA
ncbi:MAG: AlpA family phage regulatory protein [Proteobacteria bacterium]|nr:AlpA family phage regulatory protein [Pseudomonadota bacterium]